MKTSVVAAVAFSVTVSSGLAAQQMPASRDYELTGKVVMRDGARVPLSTSIELVCNGQARKRIRPYTNGDFRLVLAANDSETPDITTPGDPFANTKIPFDTRAKTMGASDAGRFDLTGCEVRAVLPGYESTVVGLGPRRLVDNPNIGQLVLRTAGSASEADAAAPEKAMTAFNSARRYLERQNPDYPRAAQELEEAVKQYPRFAAAWNLMGRTRLALGDASAAREAFARSISADPKYIEPYIHLARYEAQQGRWADANKWIAGGQRLDPSVPDLNYLGALVNFQLGQFEAAERSALEVRKSADVERFPMTYFILGTIQAQRGDLQSAAANLRRYLQSGPDPGTAESVGKLLGEWERDGKIKPVD